MASPSDGQKKDRNLINSETSIAAPGSAPAGEDTAAFSANQASDGGTTIDLTAPDKTKAKLGLTPAQQFGRYIIVRELGRGGMGAVYLAHDTQLDRQVALKVPFFRHCDSAEHIDRFYREARAMATVHHANLCPVYDVGEIDGHPFLSMAFIEGQSLSEVLKARGALPVLFTIRLIRTIALALQKAHDAGIIHRDLKPANVMLAHDDEPFVMDFGLARRDKRGEAGLTQSGVIIGSPAFMAPEQVEARHQDVGPWTDVWAMGVMLFEMLCGRRPFEGSSAAVLGRIVDREPPTFSELGCQLPAALEAVC